MKNLKYQGAPPNDGIILMPNEVQSWRGADKPFESRGTPAHGNHRHVFTRRPIAGKALSCSAASMITNQGPWSPVCSDSARETAIKESWTRSRGRDVARLPVYENGTLQDERGDHEALRVPTTAAGLLRMQAEFIALSFVSD